MDMLGFQVFKIEKDAIIINASQAKTESYSHQQELQE